MTRFSFRFAGGSAAFSLLLFSAPVVAQQFQEQQSTRFPQPAQTHFTNQLAIADVDNDGALDITFAHGQGFSSKGALLRGTIYMNNGAGFFTDESTDRLTGVGGWFRGVEYGDSNSNGYLDSAWANDFNSLPALLVNRGDAQPGYFDNETSTRLPNITLSSSRVQFFDSNNNGHLDLILTNGGSVSRFGTGFTKLYLNDGNGFYTDHSNLLPNVSVTGPMDAKIGDLTNNFDLDVRIAALGTNNSKTFYNNGDGTFSNVVLTNSNPPPATITDSTCYSYDMADINGNGNLDLFGINASGGSTNLLIRNNGNGTWTNVSSQISSNFNVDDNDSKFLDYNNNGHMDLVVARIFGPERIYQNNGSGFFTLPSQAALITSVTSSALDIGVGDLTGDGRLDIVTAVGESGSFINRIYINTGPVDTIPPKIVRTEQHPDTKDTDGPYVVRASITDSHTGDRNFFDKGIFVNYSHNGGAVQQVPMRFSGGTIYRGEIPGHEPGTIEYYITAIDFNNNLGTGPMHSFVVEGDDPVIPCPADVTGDSVVDIFDLLAVLAAWGPVSPGHPADLTGDEVVDIFDLLAVLAAWGPCP